MECIPHSFINMYFYQREVYAAKINEAKIEANTPKINEIIL